MSCDGLVSDLLSPGETTQTWRGSTNEEPSLLATATTSTLAVVRPAVAGYVGILRPHGHATAWLTNRGAHLSQE